MYQYSSFLLERYSDRHFLKVRHSHPALELVTILESTGTRFVGDSIERFQPGDIVLIGKNLPHLWLNDDSYFRKSSELMAKAKVIYFHEDLGGGLFDMPEMGCVREMLRRVRRGIKFEDQSNPDIIKKVTEMFLFQGCDRLVALLEILKNLSMQRRFRVLASIGYLDSVKDWNNEKIARICDFIRCNFKDNISLNMVADLVNMNPSSFSRYFRSIQQKTFTRYVNDLRIGHACKLLIEDEHNVAEACFESGFKNLSNFNRQFKSLRKMSPSQYLKLYSKVI